MNVRCKIEHDLNAYITSVEAKEKMENASYGIEFYFWRTRTIDSIQKKKKKNETNCASANKRD